MRVAICVIVKLENKYLLEFINHYKKLGFDSVIIYDNNDNDGENPEVIKEKYIAQSGDNSFIKIENYRGQKTVQLKAYNDCYKKYSDDFDWILYVDADEYLILVRHTNIKDFLSQQIFDKYGEIQFNWLLYNDNNLLELKDGDLINEKLNTPLFTWINRHVKCIVRTKLSTYKDSIFGNPHCSVLNCDVCDPNGKTRPNDNPFNDNWIETYSTAYIKHFYMKTVNDYKQKVNRGRADIDGGYDKNAFFFYNTWTPEKQKILDE